MKRIAKPTIPVLVRCALAPRALTEVRGGTGSESRNIEFETIKP